jgi:hypothetical protein
MEHNSLTIFVCEHGAAVVLAAGLYGLLFL